MTDIKFNCPHCGASLAVDAAGAGSSVACSRCGQTITVPQLARMATPSGSRGWSFAVLAVVALALFVAGLLLGRRHGYAQPGSSTASAGAHVFVPAVSALPNNLTRNLALYFNFDAKPVGGIFPDLSGHGNNGKAVNVRWIPNGHRGGSVQFGLTNSYIRVPDNDSLNQREMTLAAWIKTSFTDRQWRRIFDKANRQEFDLTMGGDDDVGGPNDGRSWRGQVAFEVARQWAPSGVTVADGRWHQIVGTFDGSELQIYVDGRPAGPQRRARGEPEHAPYDLTIGENGSEPKDEEGYSFNGMMDDVMMFNRALSPEQVAALYNLQKIASDRGIELAAPSEANGTNGTVTVDFNTTTVTGSPYVFGGTGYPLKAQEHDMYPKLLEAGITSIRSHYYLEEVIPSRLCASVDDYENNVNNIRDPANWDYAHLYWMDAAKRHGLRTMMLVDYCPPWLSWSGTEFGVPGDWRVWEDIVRKVYSRYRSKTDWIEIWNEPNYGYLNIKGSPYANREDALVDIWYHTETAIRSVNPKAITGGFALAWEDMTTFQDVLGKAIAKYGTDWVNTNLNFISWHEYSGNPGGPDPQAMRGALAGWGLNPDKPIFVDEWNRLKWSAPEENPLAAEEIGFVGRALTKFIQSGVAANYFSLYPYSDPLTKTGFEGERRPNRPDSFYTVNPDGRTGKLMLRTSPFRVLSRDLALGGGYYAVKQISDERGVDACAAVNSVGQKVVFIANYSGAPDATSITLKGLRGDRARIVEYWAADPDNHACVTNTIAVDKGTGVASVTLNAQTCVGLIVKDNR
ncbi:MAG: LamG-like jellyroll fold domain-containing protein [Limisphaerales bacterium]